MEPATPAMPPRLALIGGVYVDPTQVVAVRAPYPHETVAYEGTTPIRSVLILSRAVKPELMNHATPKTAAREIGEWFESLSAYMRPPADPDPEV